jgi:hypothetical protein
MRFYVLLKERRHTNEQLQKTGNIYQHVASIIKIMKILSTA